MVKGRIAETVDLKKTKHSRTKRLTLIVVIGIIIGILLWHNYYTSFDIKRIGWTVAMLGRVRSDIEKYKNLKDNYPSSLAELAKFGKEHSDFGIRGKPPKEYISRREGNTKEYEVLNGMGGWYYDKATGEVKVNLTRPVKDYLKLYFGKERKEIPSDW